MPDIDPALLTAEDMLAAFARRQLTPVDVLQAITGRVARLEDLTPTIKGIFIDLDGERCDFQAGQYVNVQIPGEETPRAFSLAATPIAGNQLELNVRRVPGGKGTAYLHDALNVGDEIRFTGPLGRFFVRKSDAQPVILMAGGSGLSSPKSMLLDLLEERLGPA